MQLLLCYKKKKERKPRDRKKCLLACYYSLESFPLQMHELNIIMEIGKLVDHGAWVLVISKAPKPALYLFSSFCPIVSPDVRSHIHSQVHMHLHMHKHTPTPSTNTHTHKHRCTPLPPLCLSVLNADHQFQSATHHKYCLPLTRNHTTLCPTTPPFTKPPMAHSSLHVSGQPIGYFCLALDRASISSAAASLARSMTSCCLTDSS